MAIHLKNWKRRFKKYGEVRLVEEGSSKGEEAKQDMGNEEKGMASIGVGDLGWRKQLRRSSEGIQPTTPPKDRPPSMGIKHSARPSRKPPDRPQPGNSSPTMKEADSDPRIQLGEEIIEKSDVVPPQPTREGPNSNSLKWRPGKDKHSKRSKHKAMSAEVDKSVRKLVSQLAKGDIATGGVMVNQLETMEVHFSEKLASLFSTGGHSFRDYTFTKVQVRNHPYGNAVSACFDMGSPISCIDRQLAETYFRKVNMRRMKGDGVKLNGIGDGKTSTTDYKILPLYMRTLNHKVIAVVDEFHVMEYLACGILVGNDVIRPNRMETRFACEETQHQDVVSCQGQFVPIQTMNIPVVPPTFRKARVIAASSAILKPGQGALIPVRIKGHFPTDTQAAFFLPSHSFSDPTVSSHASAAAAVVDGAISCVPFANFGLHPLRINAGMELWKLRPISLGKDARQGLKGDGLSVMKVEV